MKNLLFTSTLLLIVNFSFAQTKIKNDLTIKGKVSFFSESKYELVEKFGEIEKDSLRSKETYKYDEKGNRIEENQYNADGSLSSKSTYKYEFDTMGNWIKETCITDDSSINESSDPVIFVVADGSYGSYGSYLIERVIEYY